MFDQILARTQTELQQQLEQLQEYCNENAGINELVKYVIAYSDEQAYSGDCSDDAKIGRELIQLIWQISGVSLCGIGNQYHFTLSWASDLNYVISNWLYDDCGFTFEQNHRGVFKFRSANDDDAHWLQNAGLIVEAAKANVAYYKKTDGCNIFQLREQRVDDTAFFEALAACKV